MNNLYKGKIRISYDLLKFALNIPEEVRIDHVLSDIETRDCESIDIYMSSQDATTHTPDEHVEGNSIRRVL